MLVNRGVDVGPGFTSMSMQITSEEVKVNTVRKIITLRLSFRGSQWLGELLRMTLVVVGLAIAALGMFLKFLLPQVLVLYSLTSIKRSPIKRPPSTKRPLSKVSIYLLVIFST